MFELQTAADLFKTSSLTDSADASGRCPTKSTADRHYHDPWSGLLKATRLIADSEEE